MFSLLGLRPVRCLTCGKKSYIRLEEKDLTPPAAKERVSLDSPLAPAAPVAVETQPPRAA